MTDAARWREIARIGHEDGWESAVKAWYSMRIPTRDRMIRHYVTMYCPIPWGTSVSLRLWILCWLAAFAEQRP